MDGSPPRNTIRRKKHRVAIFGGGKVGYAMGAEMPGVPLIRRGDDCLCDVACICWPAQALKDFNEMHPLGAGAWKIAFANGAWALEEGMNSIGICNVRIESRGMVIPSTKKVWRVAGANMDERNAADMLKRAGMRIIRSSYNHVDYVWQKTLYIVPLALACDGNELSAKDAMRTSEYEEWYGIVRGAAVRALGEPSIVAHEPRIRYLLERTPSEWRPSSTPEEVDYFKERLCAG